MIKNALLHLLLSSASVLLVVGCANPSASGGNKPPTNKPPPVVIVAPEPEPAPPPPVAPSEPSASEKKLASAIATFDRGVYAASVAQLSPLTTDQTFDRPTQLVALKYLAFSQCLNRALIACRQTFERALRLDDKFELAPAERGHPSWGPQLERARVEFLKKKSK